MDGGATKNTLRSYCASAVHAGGLAVRLAAVALCLSVAGPDTAMAAMAADAAGEAAAAPAALSLEQGLSLAGARQCLACHRVDGRQVGPPFRAIAHRFRGDAQAAPYLAQVMRRGSMGQWGAIPMPAQTRLSPDDALQLARWILSLPPQ